MLLSPLRQEDMGRPLPDPTEQNKNIRLYDAAIAKVAKKRGFLYGDAQSFTPNAILKLGLTDNGIHLTEFGYWATSIGLLQTLNIPEGRLGLGPFAPPTPEPQSRPGHFGTASSGSTLRVARRPLDHSQRDSDPTVGTRLKRWSR